jgi:uncharacterized Fe-S cluster-containing protein
MSKIELPGLDCGVCGVKTCQEFACKLESSPEEIKKCLAYGKKLKKMNEAGDWKDSLDREFDFILDAYPNMPPREIIKPFNLSQNLVWPQDLIDKGKIIIGRPMAAGCPVTHCGKILDIDWKNDLITWHVVGPLEARKVIPIDIGMYTPVAFEGLIKETQKEIRIGERYWFMPRYCMTRWRHGALVVFINYTSLGMEVRLEGIFLG